jgi:hypothetical protein
VKWEIQQMSERPDLTPERGERKLEDLVKAREIQERKDPPVIVETPESVLAAAQVYEREWKTIGNIPIPCEYWILMNKYRAMIEPR